MKIVIHGTKGGYHIFTLERISGLIDARPDFNKVAAIGQQAYAINFNNDNVIFSKYKIIRDVIGEKRTGNIAFSIVVSCNKKLSGANVKALLDQLAEQYYLKYFDGDNLDNVREDWTFLDELKREYESLEQYIPSDDVEIIQQGVAEPAFVYYSTDDDLVKYFDSPFQQEYNQFKQIFFIKSDLEGSPASPLNALRHNPTSNLTGQIDLDNPQYTLKYKDYTRNNVKIEVLVNGKKHDGKRLIRKKNRLEIIYSKPFYTEKRKEGSLTQIDTNYISVDNQEQTITINEEIELEPVIKNITFEVKDINNKTIKDAEITVENKSLNEKIKVYNNSISVSGGKIKNEYFVEANNGNWTSGSIKFIPENVSQNVGLILDHIKVKFKVEHEKMPVSNFSIQINNKDTKYRESEITFIRPSINKPLTITISHDKYEEKSFSYRPGKDVNPVYVELRKRQTAVAQNKTEPENIEKREPFYTKPKIIVFGLMGIFTIIILCIVLVLSGTEKNHQIPNNSEEIIGYCNGNELNGKILNEYKSTICNSGISSNDNTEKSIFSKIFNLKGNEEEMTISISDVCQKIDSAIAIRNAVNLGKLYELKRKQYSNSQRSFNVAVDQIEERFIHKIGATMRKDLVSSMSLNDVASFIIKIQNLLKVDIDELQSDSECIEKIKEIDSWQLPALEIVDSVKNEINNKMATLNQSDEKPKSNNNNSDSASKNIPSPPVSPPNATKPKPQIENKSTLKTEFWNLVNGGIVKKNVYDELTNKLKIKKKNLTQEELDILII